MTGALPLLALDLPIGIVSRQLLGVWAPGLSARGAPGGTTRRGGGRGLIQRAVA
jgi:hypothetical protein